MNQNIRNVLFFLIIFCSIFNQIPYAINLPTNILGWAFDKLSTYPILIALIYTLYCQYKYKNVIVNFKYFKKYIFIYFLFAILSLLIGLYKYPYFDLILNSSESQIGKLEIIIQLFNSYDIEINKKLLLQSYLFIRTIKGIFFEIIFSFGFAYIIYCWYYEDWKEAFKIFLKATIFSFVVIVFIGSIDAFYLSGSIDAKNILEFITPYLHYINRDYGWWPPLLWKNQLRSVFSEPSYFGIWMSIAFPFLCYKIIKNDSTKTKITYYFFLFIVLFLYFLTQARTGLALLIIELILLGIFSFYLKKYDIDILKNFIIIIFCALVAFTFSSNFIFYNNLSINATASTDTNVLTNNAASADTNLLTPNTMSINKYLENNFISIFNLSSRSNSPRLSLIFANIKIGIENPLFGVGKYLVSGYMPERLPYFSKDNAEVKSWIDAINKKGIIKQGFPSFCQFTYIFAESGIIGFIIYFLPILLLIKKIIKEYIKHLEYVVLLIAILGFLLTGFSNLFYQNYYYWIILGLGYIMCFHKNDL